MDSKCFFKNILKSGAHLGTTPVAPSIFHYIQGYRGRNPLVNVQEIFLLTRRALIFLNTIYKDGNQILLVNSDPGYSNLVQFLALKLKQPYVNEAWVGGLLTNWEQMKFSITFFRQFDSSLTSAVNQQGKPFPKYLKKRKKFDGIKEMRALPAALFLFQTAKNKAILREAKLLKIPIIALVGTSTRALKIDYPIPMNTQSIKSVYVFCQLWWSVVKKM